MRHPTTALLDQSSEPTRLIGTGWDEHGNDTAQSIFTSTNLKVRALCFTTPDLVIPILFVPGIMGSRLRVKGREKASAWTPPESTWEGIILLLKHLWKSPADRQKLLDPDTTEVDDNGPAQPDEDSKALLAIAPGNTDAERAKWRGWGQVYGDSYGHILSALEKRFARMFDCDSQEQALDTHWQALLMSRQEAAKLGAQKPFTPVEDKQLRDVAEVLYPVHAVGYNWLRSNKDSGEHLLQEIDRITAYYRSKGKTCDKVIIVTHSMGGLVGRACAQLPGAADKILGIVHGVMPAIGAPATYKRMRAGFEGVEQVILGRNAAECTAVMANAPGPLELLPTAQYRARTADGEQKHWLRASCANIDSLGQQTERSIVLGEADPYAEIYLNNSDDWWKLIKEELIDPAAREEREKAKKEGKEAVEENSRKSDFRKFTNVMKKAKDLHTLIEEKYHPNTYASYAADTDRPSWNEVHWKNEKLANGDIKTSSLADDNHNGTIKLVIEGNEHRFEIDRPKGPGDGTVPAESGEAPTPHVVQIFRHEGKAKGHDSYEHQHSYKSDLVQAVTLYSIVKIVAESDWLQQHLENA